ncbi:MAG: hypothetical protein FJ222_11080 [Lentisphaerae bacterium]|nr:hypothetical protein [Lentisphaerota bacterium]
MAYEERKRAVNQTEQNETEAAKAVELDKLGLPTTGWICTGWTDMGTASSRCELCKTAIRYVHTMTNTNWREILRVGCICAAKLEARPGLAELRERFMKNRPANLENFKMGVWKRSAKGNLSTEYLGNKITLVERPKGANTWEYSLNIMKSEKYDMKDNQTVFSKSVFSTFEEAQEAAFDHVIRLEWLNEPRVR